MTTPEDFQKHAFGWACTLAKAWGWIWEYNRNGSIDIETPYGWLTAENTRQFKALVNRKRQIDDRIRNAAEIAKQVKEKRARAAAIYTDYVRANREAAGNLEKLMEAFRKYATEREELTQRKHRPKTANLKCRKIEYI